MKTIHPWFRLSAAIVIAVGLCLVLSACDAPEGSPPSGAAADSPALGTSDPSRVVARVGAEEITVGDLDAEVASDLKRIESQIYRTRRRGLDSLIETKLLESAAKEKGLSVDALLEQEVEAKIEEVTEEDAKKFFDENKARMQGEFETLKPRITRFLGERAQRTRLQTYLKTLRAATEVAVLMEPPKVRIDIGNSPVRGNPDAPVTIIEFSDYECPYCRRSQATIAQVKEKYQEKVRLVFKDFPLAFHRRAVPAASASRCAGEQGKYWEYHDKLFSGTSLQDSDFKRYAEELSLDAEKFDECLKSGRHEEAITADTTQGQSVGVTGTPAFFVNGRLLSGAQPLDAFSRIIDEELERAGAS
jgi:protein-disulfide isomerase